MALAKFGRQVKRSYHSYSFCVKLSSVVILGLCFVVVWSVFSSSSSFDVTLHRETFDDLAEPVSSNRKVTPVNPPKKRESENVHEKKEENIQYSFHNEVTKIVNGSVHVKPKERHKIQKKGGNVKRKGGILKVTEKSNNEENQENEGSENEESEKEVDDDDGRVNEEREEDVNGEVVNSEVSEDEEEKEKENEEDENKVKKRRKNIGPLFDPKAKYNWKLCSTKSKHNYIPCIDFETVTGKLQIYRHHERSCPKLPPMCLVPLPRDGYETPISWPESKLKILYKNVAHPKLASFIKKQSWVVESGEYLKFPHDQSIFKGGIQHYLESIEEMVPDIEWGKNIRIVLDIGCRDSSFAASLIDKDVLTLTLGLKNDLADLAQVALERGLPAIVTPFATRRLHFPSSVFDTIHCGECHMPWHTHGGKLMLEMNRILRPGGYFILSTKYDTIEVVEAMSTLTSSIGWNILAHKTDEISEIGVRIYQKPESNDIYRLRRKKIPPMCKENENPDTAWYVPIESCLLMLPADIEQHGTEWPEEWPKRLTTYPDWIKNREKLIVDNNHWEAIVNNSYLMSMGINWTNIRNVMDMKAINGGFAAALSQRKVWVMNVVPIHAPDTLPIIFERGLVGIYHDWCESFGTYPRSYDLLHADHLFSRLKNRCKEPVGIVVEIDRIVRPGGWVIIRDKGEILEAIEGILRSMHWDIRMTFAQDKEGILGAQKTIWRP